MSLELRPGECVGLAGRSGSGKSTLLRALAGTLPRGARVQGRVRRGGPVAMLFQNLDPQLLCGTVEEEVALGLQSCEPAAADLRRRTRQALASLGLSGFERRTGESLSAGEKQRTILAALVARDPAVLLLDEPTQALDPAGRESLVRLLGALRAAGHAIVVADHLLAPFAPVLARCLRLERGRLAEEPCPVARAAPRRRPPEECPGETLARVEKLEVLSPDGRPLLEGVDLEVRRGERVLVTGPNGAGKSTLLRALAGAVPIARGRISGPPRTGRASGVALLFQDPLRNLFERTVADEVGFTLRRQGMDAHTVAGRVGETLRCCGLESLAERSPLRSSYGEQHRVALASVLATAAPLLLLDEPFAGLDLPARSRWLEQVVAETTRRRAGLVIASHDREPFAGVVHRVVHLERGRVVDG